MELKRIVKLIKSLILQALKDISLKYSEHMQDQLKLLKSIINSKEFLQHLFYQVEKDVCSINILVLMTVNMLHLTRRYCLEQH